MNSFVYECIEMAFGGMDDAQINEMLKIIDNEKLCILLKGVSPFTRYKVLKNVTPRVRMMILEDLKNMEDVSYSEATEAFGDLVKLSIELL